MNIKLWSYTANWFSLADQEGNHDLSYNPCNRRDPLLHLFTLCLPEGGVLGEVFISHSLSSIG